jgi:DNA invertase Pin-like site-specific DNA recombinase
MGRKPSFDRTQLDAIRDLLGKGLGVTETAKQARVSRQTVYRIQADLAGLRQHSCGGVVESRERLD